jgi:transposase
MPAWRGAGSGAAAYTWPMSLTAASLPNDLAAAHVMILAERAARLEAEAAVSSARLEIERLKLLLAKARRAQYGQSAERGARLVEQLELRIRPERAALHACG